MGTVRELMERFPRVGRVEWIGVRPARRQPMRAVEEAVLVPGRGIEGDRYGQGPGGGARQVSLIQAEHLIAVARLIGRPDPVPPEILRRNVVVSGINLNALSRARFSVGAAVLEGEGACEPCSRMEEALGPGGYNVMRGHGGILARVIEGATVHRGDAVAWIGPK